MMSNFQSISLVDTKDIIALKPTSITTATTTNGATIPLGRAELAMPIIVKLIVTDFTSVAGSLRLKLEAGFFQAPGDASPTLWKEILGSVSNDTNIDDICINAVKTSNYVFPEMSIIGSPKLTNSALTVNTANVANNQTIIRVAIDPNQITNLQALRASVVSTLPSGTLASTCGIYVTIAS